MSIPSFSFLAIVYIWTGYIFAKSRVNHCYAKTVAGVAFVVWGVHKLNYPFLRPVVWFAPWGYLLAAVLEFIVALTMLLVYFQKVRDDLKKEEYFLQKAQELGKVGTWELNIPKNQLVWTEENYRIFGIPIGTCLTYETFLNLVHPDDRDLVDREWKASFDKKSYDIVHRLLVDDKIKWVREKAILEYDENETCVRGIGFTQDITELKSNQDRYKSILQTSLDGFWLTDTTGRLLEVNDAYCNMSGYSDSELLTMCVADLEAVENSELVTEHIQKVVSHGSDRFESRHRRKDGTVFDVEVSIQFRPEDGGRCVCFLRDITEHKQAEIALFTSERRYRTLFENMTQGVFHQRADGVLFDYNHAALEMFGLTHDQFIEKTSLDPQWKVIKEDGTVLPGDKHPSMIALRTGKPVRDAVVGVYNPRSNDYKWLIVNAIPQFHNTGEKPYQVFVTLQDITDRRQAELQYQMLFREMIDGFALHEIICDAAGHPVDYRFLAVNPAFEKMTGLKAAQIINRTVLDVLPGIERHWIEIYGKVALTGEPAFFENYSADIGKHFQVTAFRPSPDQFACIFIDITERKQAEDALKESELFLENMSDIAYRADALGNLVWVNSAAERVTGLSRKELVEKPFLPLFIEADHPSLMDVYKRTLMGESLENTLTFTSGVTCHFTSLPRRNENGEIIGTFGVARDITAQLDAQRALQTSEARLKKAQETAKIGNWEYDIPTGKVWGSEEAFRIYGIERTSEFLPLDAVESHILDAKKVNLALVDLITKRKVYDIEFQIESKDREGVTIIHSMADLVLDSDGNPVKVQGVIQDITDFRRMEEERRQSEETYRNLLNNLNAGVVVHAPDTSILIANSTACTLLGLKTDQILGKEAIDPHWQFVREDGSEMPQDEYPVNQVLSTVEPLHNQVVGVKRPHSDDVAWLLVNGFAVPKVSGQVEQVIISFIDITERKKVEEALRQSEKDLKASQRIAHLGSWHLDLATNQVEWTEELCNMYGFDPTLPPPPYTEHMKLFTSESWEKLSTALARTRETGIPYELELETVREDGTKGWMWVRGERENDSAGNTIGLWGAAQDITERKRAEKEKEDLEGKLRQALKMEAVGRLAGGVAHDFNNMLSVIIGQAEMSLEGVDPSQPLYANLEEIKNAGMRSADLTRQLLAFARKQTVAPKVLNLNKTVGGMTLMLQRLIGENIDLAWLPYRNLWQVKMDPSQIDQILANLCVNARDAIADVGKITIETGNAVFDETYCNDHVGFLPGEYVLLVVSDNGCGMTPETMGNIFEPFFTTKESGKGTGLGLATVYGVVKQNNGFVNVYSEPGQGTTFRIYLPRHLTKTAHASEKTLPPPLGRGHETILLVEDEPAILRMTTMMLERLGYTVVAAKTPGDAISLAHEYTGMIDLLVTDVVMPEMNGRDLAKNILSFYPNLKRLFMSGYTANVIAHHGVLDEGVNFIQKPFSRENLGAKVREVLDADKD